MDPHSARLAGNLPSPSAFGSRNEGAARRSAEMPRGEK